MLLLDIIPSENDDSYYYTSRLLVYYNLENNPSVDTRIPFMDKYMRFDSNNYMYVYDSQDEDVRIYNDTSCGLRPVISMNISDITFDD